MALAHRAKNTYAALPFISTWKTDNLSTGSSTNTQVKLPLVATGTYKFTVNWGDGSSNVITTWDQAEVTHTYAAIGTYTITITGFIKGWQFGPETPVPPTTGDRLKLLTITQFGCLRFTNDAFMFHGCSNLSVSGVTDIVNLKNITSAHGFFRLCGALTNINNINKWDVSKIQNFRRFFSGARNFNDNVGNWNTTNGTNFSSLFYALDTVVTIGKFNNGGSPSINNWGTSNVTDMSGMFLYQPFNQPIGNWDTSKVTNMTNMFQGIGNSSGGLGVFNQDITDWDVSKVTSMYAMFSGQAQFNQDIGQWDVSKVTNSSYMLQSLNFNNGGSPSINNWDVSKVTTVTRMFQGAFNFNQPIDNWKVPLVTDFYNFMYEGGVGIPYAFSVTNYSNFLIALAAQPLQPNMLLRVYQYYDSTALAARAILTSAPNNWTLVDRGSI